MLKGFLEIVVSVLCVYGGYRLLHDLADSLVRRLNRNKNGNGKKK